MLRTVAASYAVLALWLFACACVVAGVGPGWLAWPWAQYRWAWFAATAAFAACAAVVYLRRPAGEAALRREFVAAVRSHSGGWVNREAEQLFITGTVEAHPRALLRAAVCRIPEETAREIAAADTELAVSCDLFSTLTGMTGIIRTDYAILVTPGTMAVRSLPGSKRWRAAWRSERMARAGLGTVRATVSEIAEIVSQLDDAEQTGQAA